MAVRNSSRSQILSMAMHHCHGNHMLHLGRLSTIIMLKIAVSRRRYISTIQFDNSRNYLPQPHIKQKASSHSTSPLIYYSCRDTKLGCIAFPICIGLRCPWWLREVPATPKLGGPRRAAPRKHQRTIIIAWNFFLHFVFYAFVEGERERMQGPIAPVPQPCLGNYTLFDWMWQE